MVSKPDPWFVYFRSVEAPRARLFCFPYAGGSAYTYFKWPSLIPANIDVCAIELPGRGTRVSERPAFMNVSSLVERLSTALSVESGTDLPFFFFGHSMGALLAFLCAHALRRGQIRQPNHLFVSGRLPPNKPNLDSRCATMNDRELTENLRKRGGIAPQILAERELMEMLLPIIRSDFVLLDSYVYTDESPLSCPITAYGGTQDETVNAVGLSEWSFFTTGPFDTAMFEGGHFFVDSCRDLVISKVSHSIKVALSVVSCEAKASDRA